MFFNHLKYHEQALIFIVLVTSACSKFYTHVFDAVNAVSQAAAASAAVAAITSMNKTAVIKKKEIQGNISYTCCSAVSVLSIFSPLTVSKKIKP